MNLVKKEGSEKAEKLFTTGLHPQDAILLDVIYYPNINEFRGRKTVQYILQDYK